MKEAVCNQCGELKKVFSTGICNSCNQLNSVSKLPGKWMNGIFVLQKWIDALPGLNVLARSDKGSGTFVFTLPCNFCGATRTIDDSIRLRFIGVPCRSCARKQQVEKYGVWNRIRADGVPYNLLACWHDMMRRCRKCGDAYLEKYYYNRGIRVIEEWKEYKSFENWAMASGYAEGLTLERKDNDGNYEPGNCRWATWAQQGHNRRDNKLTEASVIKMRELYASGTVVISELAVQFGITPAWAKKVIENKHWKSETFVVTS